MGQLCIYLTPFASDYSGACSALFDLNCITAINDAGCCTSHYVYYDEPRWNDNVRPVFSTAIRNIDSILGNDDKIINVICDASAQISNEMIAVIGTPVPALTGMDMDGIAAEIEYRTGKPAFGFNTTGFDYYDKGIFMAGKALIDRFAQKTDMVPGRVNICGMTPLDYGNCGNDKLLEQFLSQNGYEICCRFFMGITVEQVGKCASAQLNIAVSSSGLKLAEYLKKKFGTPYVCGFPVGNYGLSLPGMEEKYPENDVPSRDDRRILLIHDQVTANSVRDALIHDKGLHASVTVGTFFGFDSSVSREGDIHFREEADYLNVLRSGEYDVVIGDPDIINVPAAQHMLKIPFVHPAVSSELKWNETAVMDESLLAFLADKLETDPDI